MTARVIDFSIERRKREQQRQLREVAALGFSLARVDRNALRRLAAFLRGPVRRSLGEGGCDLGADTAASVPPEAPR